MFFKNSRYRNQPSAVTLDARNRRLKSVTLRIVPKTEGSFLHTVTEGDRLDHLAYRYYRAPRKWWRITDANPESFSPLDLLEPGVEQSVRIPLGYDDTTGQPPWSALAAKLRQLTGITDYRFDEQVLLAEHTLNVNGEEINVADQSYRRGVIIDYNKRTVTVETLTDAVSDAGFSAGIPEDLSRLGRQIVIPPDAPG